MAKKSKNNLIIPLYKDFRGEIRRYEINGTKFNVLLTKAGMLRSGDYHPEIQYDLILKGEFEIWLKKGNKDVKIKKGPNQLIVIPPSTPHLFKALTDTLMIEWWSGDFEAEYYQPYRSLIEKQLEQHNKIEQEK